MNQTVETPVWLPVGHPDNPFSCEVLDCRAIALSFASMTTDVTVITTFMQWQRSDGHDLKGQEPKDAVAVPGQVRLAGNYVLDGPLFIAPEMEHKWNLYAYDGRFYARRSWTGDLIHTATIMALPEELVLDNVQSNRDDALYEIEFLLSWYVARRGFPFLIPENMFEITDADLQRDPDARVTSVRMLMAFWGWTAYGRVAQFGRRRAGNQDRPAIAPGQ